MLPRHPTQSTQCIERQPTMKYAGPNREPAEWSKWAVGYTVPITWGGGAVGWGKLVISRMIPADKGFWTGGYSLESLTSRLDEGFRHVDGWSHVSIPLSDAGHIDVDTIDLVMRLMSDPPGAGVLSGWFQNGTTDLVEVRRVLGSHL